MGALVVGDPDGALVVGVADGIADGDADGDVVGAGVGDAEGAEVVGEAEGSREGDALGLAVVGDKEGAGLTVGLAEGEMVGGSVSVREKTKTTCHSTRKKSMSLC